MAISRRTLLAGAASLLQAAGKRLPIGLELYSVRTELAADPMGTVRQVAKMGYEVVEFFSPYYNWTKEQASDMRKLLDDLGVKCLSTHNSPASFSDTGIDKAIDLNHIIGAKYVVLAQARAQILDDWKKVGDTVTRALEKFRPAGLLAGYHNHQAEFRLLEGKRPIEVLAANTPKDFMLQLDVGTCVEVGSDPVAWIEANPGRIRSLHLKDWAPQGGYRVLFGEGACPWKKVLEAAERVGGAEYYLIEQEGSAYPAIETAARCLATYRKLSGLQ